MEEIVTPMSSKSPSSGLILGLVLVVTCLGIGAGFLLSKNSRSTASKMATGSNMINTKTEVGSNDTQTFRDSATGTIEAGGLNGEGTHKLVRDGGPSQTVYLISSVVDLSTFVGKKVEVWGDTQKATKVSWLMDVGRVKLLE